VTWAATRQLIDGAVEGRNAVLAFNVIGLEHAEGIVAGAERADTPVLLQVSENAILFRGAARPLLAACAELARAAVVPVGIHLDHMTRPDLTRDLIEHAGEYGIGSVMIDGSALDYAKNVTETLAVAELARSHGLWVEAELGAIGGKGGAHAPGVRTDPAEAVAFVSETHVDGLAVAIGSTHGAQSGTTRLDLALLKGLAEAVTVPLVLHGSSGVSLDELALAIKGGIRKINVGTALNRAALSAIAENGFARHGQADPRPTLETARSAVAAEVFTFLDALT